MNFVAFYFSHFQNEKFRESLRRAIAFDEFELLLPGSNPTIPNDHYMRHQFRLKFHVVLRHLLLFLQFSKFQFER